MTQATATTTPVVTCSSATLADIEELGAAVKQALSDQSDVAIDNGALDAVDLSFLQLMEAARCEAAAQSKSIRLTHPAGAQLADLLARSGRLTRADADDHAFWFHGELPQ